MGGGWLVITAADLSGWLACLVEKKETNEHGDR
jgi:hypothetical protein